ncbi:DUF1178 family protein [Novosphingobium mangrovi (ex Huang et al. 2023)]|uniref:DUF1178 family protein n=1 Tax=Novosphingobium mangrovi (ex Huang et al. 2023) TaxID=2976432 RepID=A0ABT2I400_9SPHN|nr:DUF1178 family protein [Novosphingobium mangrovi (ex Huang et al. 2023)]MCT2399536.1 DUF1178 family protein [Novosphingobium mangrovi (ex Huang et al. 2023)]
MIVYDLECRGGSHRFEGWFKSSEDFARQKEMGLVSCPHCGSADVDKAVQAPRLARKGNQLPEPAMPRHEPRMPAQPAVAEAPAAAPAAAAPVANAPLPPEAVEMMHKLVKMQAEALKSSRYVGESFAEDARAMHYGEQEVETIHGHATLAEAEELLEEGIAVVPLPFPALPPDQAN